MEQGMVMGEKPLSAAAIDANSGPTAGSKVRTEIVADADGDMRLDRWFKKIAPGLSHGRLEKLLRTGQVRVDGKRAKSAFRLVAGQTVRIPPLDLSSSAPAKPPKSAMKPASKSVKRLEEDLLNRILHHDKSIIVLNKPAGLAVQGGSGTSPHVDGLLDALILDGDERPRLVHRLDKDTSGILVLARTAGAARKLTAAFKSKDVRKLYWTIVIGSPRPMEGTINLPLAKLPGRGGEKMVPDERYGQHAVTDFRTVDTAGKRAAWLAMMPVTGRTHQLRAHAAAIGHPILGDGKYGGQEAFLSGLDGLDAGAKKLHLHARAIQLPHPERGRLTLVAPMPPHMEATWRYFNFEASDRGDPFLGFSDLG